MKTLKNSRKWIQLFFVLLIGTIAINHTLAETGGGISWFSSASIHALCPFGGVETFYQLLTTGEWLQKIHPSAMVLFGIVTGLAVLFGPVFCGWICPLGTVQEWVGSLGRKLLGKRYNRLMPRKVHSILKNLRYLVLALILYMTAKSGLLLFSDLDPYYALFHFWTTEVSLIGLLALGLVLLSSLFVERPWCQYACPYGAMLGLTNKFRVFKIKRQANTCIDCGACDRACPMNIEVSTTSVVTDTHCISCYKCTSTSSCPIPKTVNVEGLKGKHLSPYWIGGITLGMLFIGISLSSVFGLWLTESEKTPTKTQLETGEWISDPLDIRGSYSFEEVVTIFEIPGEALIAAFDLPKDTDLALFKSKDLEAMNLGYGNSTLQLFVALYLKLPYTPEEWETGLPQSAITILQAYDKPIPGDLPILEPTALEATPEATPEATSEGDEEAHDEPLVNGNTTFYQLMAAGITQEAIEEALGMAMPSSNTNIRSFCQQNGISFSEFKLKFEE